MLLIASTTGDVVAVLGFILAVASFLYGLRQHGEARRAREEAAEMRERTQAEQVSAWAEKRSGDTRVVVVSNGSDRPIHDVSAWLVPADYDGAGVPDRKRTTGTAVLERGTDHEYSVATTGSAPARRPRLIVAFEDADGRKWLRTADRQLIRLRH